MPDNDKTIYKTCREAAGYTQERAAELLNLSVRQLARFEAGELIPGNDIVYAMVVLYDSQYLGIQHLRSASQLAADIIPEVEPVTLQTAAMRFFNAFMDIIQAHPELKLMRIAEDNIISEDERPIRDEILEMAQRFCKVCFEVQAATEREV